MNRKSRQQYLQQLRKEAELKAIIAQTDEQVGDTNAADGSNYAENLLTKMLDNIAQTWLTEVPE